MTQQATPPASSVTHFGAAAQFYTFCIYRMQVAKKTRPQKGSRATRSPGSPWRKFTFCRWWTSVPTFLPRMHQPPSTRLLRSEGIIISMWALYPQDPPIRAGLIRAGSRVVSSCSLRRRAPTMHLCFYIRHISATARVLTSRVESTGKAFTAITAQPLTFYVASQTPQAALQSLLTAG